MSCRYVESSFVHAPTCDTVVQVQTVSSDEVAGCATAMTGWFVSRVDALIKCGRVQVPSEPNKLTAS